jgi:hypothetical protein
LQDPRIVQQYISNLHRHLDHHNVFPRLEALQEAFCTKQWDNSTTSEYETLDAIIIASMLSAEKDLSRRITTTYQWSPCLKQAVQRFRYWQLRLWQVRNQPVAVNQLLRYQTEGVISEVDQKLASEQDVKKAQHEAYQQLKRLQQQHQELRDSYLEDLTEAIILDRSPHLAADELEALKVEKKEKQLKQLISCEKMWKIYRKIGRVLNKLGGKGLSKIDVQMQLQQQKVLETLTTPKRGEVLGNLLPTQWALQKRYAKLMFINIIKRTLHHLALAQ